MSVLLLGTGLSIQNALSSAGLDACLGATEVTDTCAEQATNALNRHAWIEPLTSFFHFAPVILGIALAVPLVWEFEHRTYRLAWTQSVTRGRWVITKLAIGLLLAVSMSAVIALLVGWWRAPLDEAQGRFDPNGFNVEGPVVISYTVFALAVAVVVGVYTRRLAASLIVAVIGVMISRILVEAMLRPRYLDPQTELTPADLSTGKPVPLPLDPGDWLLSSRLVDANGVEVPRFCGPDGCPDSLFYQIVYQPAERFWAFQGIESALFLGMSLVLLAGTVWWVKYRTA
jgi:hypothetical protein